MSLMVIFPLGEEAAADSYLAWCNANNPDLQYDANAIWYPNNRVDIEGRRVVGYLGPGGRLDILVPIAGEETARGPGILQEGVIWPPIPDD